MLSKASYKPTLIGGYVQVNKEHHITRALKLIYTLPRIQQLIVIGQSNFIEKNWMGFRLSFNRKKQFMLKDKINQQLFNLLVPLIIKKKEPYGI